jgi:endonuclease/exonuclease/phosphatase family metal-dependent hydrolase
MTLTVATWNLENLFRPGSEFGPDDQATYDTKLTGLADVIDRLAPDVLAVEEVGDPDALADLTAKLDGDWHTALSDVFEPDHPIRVAVLARNEITAQEQISAFPAKLRPVQVDDTGATIDAMPRGALKVRVVHDGLAVDLVACHLKSKLLSFPGGRFNPHDEGERARFAAYALDRRAAEAVTVRGEADALFDGHGADRAVIVLGDLNDEPLAATTQILLGPPGSEIGTAGFDHPDQGDARRLWNLAPLLPADHAFTRTFMGRHELIDHILVSRRLVAHASSVDTGDVTPPSVGPDPSARSNAPASDHAPLIARFDV